VVGEGGGGGGGGGGRGAVIAHGGVTDALHRRDDDRHVLGPAAGHDRVDGDLLRGDRYRPVRDERDLLLGIETRGREHHRHAVLGRRDDRQPVGPSLLEAELPRVDVVDAIPLGRQRNRHARLLSTTFMAQQYSAAPAS